MQFLTINRHHTNKVSFQLVMILLHFNAMLGLAILVSGKIFLQCHRTTLQCIVCEMKQRRGCSAELCAESYNKENF